MTVHELLKDHDIEIDDVRWFLSVQLALKLLEYRDRPSELTDLIWRGKLDTELYDMEEEYLRTLQSDLDRNLKDMHAIREIVAEIIAEKRKRYESG